MPSIFHRRPRQASPVRAATWFKSACLLGPALPGAARAAESVAAAAGLGPWIFGSVALGLVAVLAWLVGRQQGRAERGSQPEGDAAASRRVAEQRSRAGEGRALARPAVAAPDVGSVPAPAAQTLPADDDPAAFSYALSHDLRAPLRVVEGFARILKEDYGRQLDRIGNDHLDRMLGAAARMNSMIEAMLSLAQLSSRPLARQPVNLSQLAGFVIDDLRRAQPEREVTVEIEPELRALGDPTLLRQLLENLLGNAWKYTARTAAPRIRLRAVQHQGQAAFEVSDNGAGFDMRSADRLFGLFQRLHGSSEFQGTGVGLASVLRIVRRHGGQIWAESEPGNGAQFTFTLPG
jgi:signal transduction histidine kinase